MIFNSGYDFLNGQYPFKDYWTIKEPFIDFLQAVFFKLFGVSWFTYVLHASVFNCLITVSTFFILTNFSLKPELSFFYSTCVAILTYPSAGTPFSDHHTLILCLISLYIFFLAIKYGNKFLWIFIPIILGLSFLSKQAPTVYITFIIKLNSLIYFIALKKKECFYFALLGFFIFIFSFLSILYSAEINFEDFLIQYILFPQSLGATRLDWIFPLEFQ